ncbi:MAG: alpha/beta hydrolase, partial [Gemmatimonadota bacterium]
MSIRSVDVTVAGVRSLVRTGGPEDANEAVVFVHGNPGSSEDFADLLTHVSDFARVLAPDMPGYGKA